MHSTAYRDLFRTGTVRWEAAMGLLAQLTQGAAGIGLILVIRAHAGSLGLAGSVVGALSISAGLARPVQGGLIDRRGASALMTVCGLIHSAALAGIVGLAQARAPGITMVALGVLAGLALPPVSTTMRVVWGSALPEGEHTAAYSLVYLIQELSILTGPLLLSGLLALGNASLALIVVAALAGAGTVAFAALIAPQSKPRPRPSSRRRWGMFREPGTRILVGIAALTGAVIGALEVAVPITATSHHAPAASGLLIAALAVGGIAGATVYGTRRWLSAPSRRLLVLLTALAVTVALMIAARSLVVLGALLLLAGLSLNPSLTTISLLVDDHAPRTGAAEAFGWLSLGIAGGTGAAAAIAGAVTHVTRPQNAFIVATIVGLAAVLLAAATRGALSRKRSRR